MITWMVDGDGKHCTGIWQWANEQEKSNNKMAYIATNDDALSVNSIETAFIKVLW